MAYTDDAVLAKLSALNETHDSIATAAQWIMFHRRHAERTVQLWFQRLKDSPSPKRLNLVYLANEVTQQSKARHKQDFVLAFAPVIAEAIAAAYKGAPSEVQAKLRRVIDVWRERSIFEAPIQAAVESRLGELDKARGVSRPGGSIFGSSSSTPALGGAAFPAELASLVAPQQNVTRLLLPTQGSVSKAETDYTAVMDGPPPADAVYAARLNGLQRTLGQAEESLGKLVAERTALVTALAALHAKAQAELDANLQQLATLQRQRGLVGERKQSVEDRILQGLGGGSSNGGGGRAGAAAAGGEAAGGGDGGGGGVPSSAEPPRPEVEALTPPPPEVEALTPPQPEMEAFTPPPMNDTDEAETAPQQQQQQQLAERTGNGGSNGRTEKQEQPEQPTAASAIALLSQLAAQTNALDAADAPNKRRRLNPDGDVPDLDDGIDADVAEALRMDSQI